MIARPWPPRSRVLGAHFLATLVIALLLAVLYKYGWYPEALFRVAGGDRLLALHVAALLATGPLLSAILYRPGKRGLRTDLWMIAALQLATIAGGLYAGYFVRPAFIAVLPMRATLVRANQIVPDPAPAADAIGTSPWQPRIVAVDDPPTPEARSTLMFAVLEGAPDIDYRPAFYRSIDTRIDLLIDNAIPLPARLADAPQFATAYGNWLEERDIAPGPHVRLYPVAGTTREVELVLDGATRTVVGYFVVP